MNISNRLLQEAQHPGMSKNIRKKVAKKTLLDRKSIQKEKDPRMKNIMRNALVYNLTTYNPEVTRQSQNKTTEIAKKNNEKHAELGKSGNQGMAKKNYFRMNLKENSTLKGRLLQEDNFGQPSSGGIIDHLKNNWKSYAGGAGALMLGQHLLDDDQGGAYTWNHGLDAIKNIADHAKVGENPVDTTGAAEHVQKAVENISGGQQSDTPNDVSKLKDIVSGNSDNQSGVGYEQFLKDSITGKTPNDHLKEAVSKITEQRPTGPINPLENGPTVEGAQKQEVWNKAADQIQKEIQAGPQPQVNSVFTNPNAAALAKQSQDASSALQEKEKMIEQLNNTIKQKDAENYLSHVVNKQGSDFIRTSDNDYNPALFTSDNKWPWSPDTKGMFTPDTIHPRELNTEEVPTDIAREDQANVLNKAYENWMQNKEQAAAAYNTKLAEIENFAKQSLQDGKLSPQEVASITNMNTELTKLKPDDVFDVKDAEASLNQEFDRDKIIGNMVDKMKADGKITPEEIKSLNEIIKKNSIGLDNLDVFKDRFTQYQKEALPKAIEAIKQAGLGGTVLGNDSQKALLTLEDLKNHGALKPEFEPLYNQLKILSGQTNGPLK